MSVVTTHSNHTPSFFSPASSHPSALPASAPQTRADLLVASSTTGSARAWLQRLSNGQSAPRKASGSPYSDHTPWQQAWAGQANNWQFSA